MRQFVFLSTLLIPTAPVVAFGEGIPLERLTISGQILGESGEGIEGARVYVSGEDYETASDALGNYELMIPLHEFGNFKSKTKVRIKVKGGKTIYHTTTRQATLALDIKRVSHRGQEHCEIRGNEGRLVRRVGEAINLGERELRVESIRFVYPIKTARRLTMKAKSVVIMGDRKPAQATSMTSPAPGSAALMKAAAGTAVGTAATPVPASTPVPTPAASRSTDGSAQVRRVGEDARAATPAPAPAKGEVVKMPGPGVTQTDASVRRLPAATATGMAGSGALAPSDVLPGDDGCECRIRGTIELHPDHLLTERLQVFISLAQASAVRDTVELFMGSPRSFELRPLGCADWNLRVDAVSKRDFGVVSVDGSRPVQCTQGGLRQLRIVLAPR